MTVFQRPACAKQFYLSVLFTCRFISNGFCSIVVARSPGSRLACFSLVPAMNSPTLRFAFRYWLVEPENEGPWPESAASHVPKPPLRWVASSAKSRWHEWRLGTDTMMLELPNSVSIRDVQTTSIAWCTEFSTYWITPFDCSSPATFNSRAQEPQKDWSLLYFRDLETVTAWPRPGLYQALPHGNKPTLNFKCPQGFDDFLPRQKFRPEPPGSERSCHLFGKMSLILALYAMCPGDEDNILSHIKQFFFRGRDSRFIPATAPGTGQQLWVARDRAGESALYLWNSRDLALIAYPERALVMQTGIIADGPNPDYVVNLYKGKLRLWESGQLGPMVSSHLPTSDELQAWQRPQA